MGLSSGGGSRSSSSSSGGGFVSGLILGKIMSDNSSQDSLELSVGGLIACGIVGIGVLGSMIGAVIYTSKEATKAKTEFNNTIVETLHNNGYKSVSTVDATYFDWETNNDDYFFKFTGNASNLDGEKIDFFSIKYKVNEQQYYDTLSYIDKNNIEDLDTPSLLNRLGEIIKTSELTSASFKENVTTQETENEQSYDKADDAIILSVSKPKVKDGKVSYRVSYVQAVKTTDGKIGTVTSSAVVSYDANEELSKNPSMVFLKDKSNAKVKVVKRTFSELKQYDMVRYTNNELSL